MRLRYSGNHDAVDTLDGQTVERGKTADFDPDLGKRLLQQDVWTKVNKPRTPRAKATPKATNDDKPQEG